MQDNSVKPTDESLSPLMTEHAFALWGVEDIAYIKQVSVDGAEAWAICAADGTSLGVLPDRHLAFAAAIQNDRVAVSVH